MRFGGLKALSRVDLELAPGQIHALIGPNGSGKTTLINVVTGFYQPAGGKVQFNGREITGLPTHRIAGLGIARTFQNLRLFGGVSVLQNVMIAQHTRSRSPFWSYAVRLRATMREESTLRAEALNLLEYTGLRAKAEEPAHSLSYGEQRMLELARALALQPSLLLLDEPAAGLNPAETTYLMRTVRELAARQIGILLVEHDMKAVMGNADRITVLDHGLRIAEGTPEEIQCNPQVIEAYLGTKRKVFA